MKNKIEDLRNHLFATLEGLLDPDKPLEIERAKAVSEVAQTIINSQKVENDFMRITNVDPCSGFIPEAPRGPRSLQLVGDQSKSSGRN